MQMRSRGTLDSGHSETRVAHGAEISRKVINTNPNNPAEIIGHRKLGYYCTPLSVSHVGFIWNWSRFVTESGTLNLEP